MLSDLASKSKEYIHFRKNGETQTIIDCILQNFELYKYQTFEIAKNFQGKNLKDTCKKIYLFVKNNIKYQKDEGLVKIDNRWQEKQVIKSPAKLAKDRVGDCKSFSIFCGSILHNLGINFAFRFAGYKGDTDYTHIYIVVNHEKKDKIILDATLPIFDFEPNFLIKKDYNMSGIIGINGVKKNGIGYNLDFSNLNFVNPIEPIRSFDIKPIENPFNSAPVFVPTVPNQNTNNVFDWLNLASTVLQVVDKSDILGTQTAQNAQNVANALNQQNQALQAQLQQAYQDSQNQPQNKNSLNDYLPYIIGGGVLYFLMNKKKGRK